MPEQPKLSPKAKAMTEDLAKLPGRIDTYFSSYIDSNTMSKTKNALTKYEAILSVVDLGSDLIRQSFTPEQKQELYASLTELKDESLKISPRSKREGIKSMLAQLQDKLDKPADKPFTAPEDIKAWEAQGADTLDKITERINTVKNEAIEVKKSLTSYKVKKNLSSSKLGKLGKKTIRELNDIKKTMRGHQNSSTEGQTQQKKPIPQRRSSSSERTL